MNNLLPFFWRYISFFFGISLLAFFECNFFEDFFETLVILSAILLPIISPVASTVL